MRDDVTQDYFQALPPVVCDHLVCRVVKEVVKELVPVTQKHDIEGLLLGVAELGGMA